MHPGCAYLFIVFYTAGLYLVEIDHYWLAIAMFVGAMIALWRGMFRVQKGITWYE